MTNISKRRKNEFIGRMAEKFAILYMAFKAYRCIGQRYKCSAGEIDLIFKRGQQLIFCEVKYRSDKNMLLFSLSHQQQQRIRRAAEIWLAHNKSLRHNVRFDFIGLTLWQKPIHIKNAF